MTLDEWVDVVKAIGPDSFKAVACAYLRERFARPVQFVDGTGDGGVDAWIVKSDDPLVRHAAQFYAGERDRWKPKLDEDVEKVARFRRSIEHDADRRLDFGRLFFVCALEPSATTFVDYADAVYEKLGIRIELCDARSIAGLALQNPRGALFTRLAERLPGYKNAYAPKASAREQALLAFAVFDEGAKNFRRAVAKNAVLATSSALRGGCSRGALEDDACRLLGLSSPSKLVSYAVRDLLREGRLLVDANAEPTVRASDDALTSMKAATAVAQRDLEALRARCVALIEREISPGRHHRLELAARAVAPLLANLGALVREPVEERLLLAFDPTHGTRDFTERRSLELWKQTADEMARELDQGSAAKLLSNIVKEVAADPFSRRLAAAELSFRLTEFDASAFEDALGASHQHILLDASIAMPMLCARLDGVIESWTTSMAASELHEVARQRGARLYVASAHLEEMAAHLYRAKDFAPLFAEANAPDLKRSRNYYVAHFASSSSEQTRPEFERFLASLGLTEPRRRQVLEVVRGDIERALANLLRRYSIERRDTEALDTTKPLPGEPADRDPLLLRHDRAVIGSLDRWTQEVPWLVCSADRWLRDVLNEKDILAVDSVGLTDLLSLVQPSVAARPLMSTMELALAVNDADARLASDVWDAIVKIDGTRLSDRRLFERARDFRDAWLESRRGADEDVVDAWKTFRDTGMLPPRHAA